MPEKGRNFGLSGWSRSGRNEMWQLWLLLERRMRQRHQFPGIYFQAEARMEQNFRGEVLFGMFEEIDGIQEDETLLHFELGMPRKERMEPIVRR